MQAEDSEGSVSEPRAPKKSRLGLVLATVVVVVLVTGAAVAGTIFGPKLLRGGSKAEPAASAKTKEHEKDKPVGETVEMSPILVDARAQGGELHHLKVVLAIEVAEGTPKEEFMKYSLRGREAAVAYLRGSSFEEIAAPRNYAEVRAELAKKFTEATGEKHVARVMVIDFVAQ
jgi:flagellar basal body-associated protein FliL